MRKIDAATRAALTGHHGDAPVKLVCLALMLALVALGWRILAVW